MESYLGFIIEALVLIGVGYAVVRKMNSLDNKVDSVLENQQKQNVIIAEIKKDVEATMTVSEKTEAKAESNAQILAEHNAALTGLKEWRIAVDKTLENLHK